MKYWKNKAIQDLNEAELRQGLSDCIDKVEQLAQRQQTKPFKWLQFVKNNKDILNITELSRCAKIDRHDLFLWVHERGTLSESQKQKLKIFIKSTFE